MPSVASSGINRKRRKGKGGSSVGGGRPSSSLSPALTSPSIPSSSPPATSERLPSANTLTEITYLSDDETTPLILTGDKRRGLFECDYCRMDISQVPRIRCAVCSDFDLCLDCFATTDPSAAGTIRAAAAAAAATVSESGGGDDESGSGKRKRGGGGDGGSNETSSIIPPGLSTAAANHDHTHGYRVADSTRFPVFPAVRSVIPANSNRETESRQKFDDGEEVKEEGGEDGDAGADEGGKVEERNEKKEGGEGGKKDEVKLNSLEDGSFAPSLTETSALLSSFEKSAPEKKKEGEEVRETEKNVLAEEKKEEEEELEIIVVPEDPKSVWTAEEDLRLLDAIATLGLGNWADISEAVSSGPGIGGQNSNKSARRCMERYCDDFLGQYGEILPPYTLVETESDEEENAEGGAGGDGLGGQNDDAMSIVSASESEISSIVTGGRSSRSNKRKERPLLRSLSSGKLSVTSSKSAVTARIKKRMKVVPTSSLPGYEDVWPDPYIPPLPGIRLGDEVGRDYSYRAEQTYVKTVTSAMTKEEADAIRREWMEKRLNQIEGPKVLPPRLEDIRTLPGSELAGFMPRRGDFDIEWDNEAESIIAEMEFSPNDHPQDRQLKLQVLELYNAKLDERERRKQFLIERNLLNYRANQAKDQLLPRDERDLVQRMRLFARFHSSEEHEQFVQDLLKAKRLRKEIARLQMYRRMGITSLAEAERYELDKSRREHHKLAQLQKEKEEEQAEAAAARAVAEGSSLALSGIAGAGGVGSTLASSSSSLWKQYKSSDRKSRRSINRDFQEHQRHDSTLEGEGANANANAYPGKHEATEKGDDDSNKKKFEENKSSKENEAESGRYAANNDPPGGKQKEFDIVKAPGYGLLSTKEVTLCKKLQLRPLDYLDVKKALIQESLTHGILDKEGSNSSHRAIVKIDVEKRDDIIDFIVRAGWISARPATIFNNAIVNDADVRNKMESGVATK